MEKVLGQGRLAGDVRTALAYALGLRSLDSIVVGMESERELRENMRLVEEHRRRAASGDRPNPEGPSGGPASR